MSNEPAKTRPASGSKAKDFNGKLFTLPRGADAWRYLGGSGRDALLLGTPADCSASLPNLTPGGNLYCLPGPEGKCPESCTRVAIGQALELAANCQVHFYRPALRIQPEYWAPLLAQFDLALADRAAWQRVKMAWLPGNSRQLVHLELKNALQNCGYGEICEASPAPNAADLRNAWQNRLPALAISVNFNGLDANGHIFELCRALGVPLAIWLVDNPWNLLSGIQLPWWKEAHLLVTDKSFIPGLQANGAQHVWHMPLAASWHMFEARGKEANGKPLFVGRSSFPDKARYFAGLRTDPALLAQANTLSDRLPDFHWWREQYNLPLWPGRQMRQISLGAEEMSTSRKSQWLKTILAERALEIIGDDGWQSYLGDVETGKPVDYYGSLPSLYAGAGCVLNITSLLLPGSLNQRHFDVWAAGGYLLSDATPGLEIFPEELVKPVICQNASEMASKMADMRNREELGKAWREHIASLHRYEHRVRQIERILNMGTA